MEVYIDNKDLEDLYRTGRSRKLKLPAQVVDKFFATAQKIEAAETIRDLLADQGLHFEKLKSTSNRYSMRLNQKYRTFILLTISNHYD